jgi:hypothetical protein
MTQVGDGLPLPGRRKRGQKTREEYLATSLSRLKPWEAEGISRATFYRRKSAPRETSPPHETTVRGETTPPDTSPARETTVHGETSPPRMSAVRKPTRADRADARNSKSGSASPLGERLRLVRLVDDILEAQGQKTLTKRTDTKTLPKPYQDMQLETLRQSYRRALKALPADYHRRLSLVQLWGSRHREWEATPKAAREFFDDLILTAGEHRIAAVFDYIDHLDRQRWCWKTAKVFRLRSLLDTVKAHALNGNLLYSPMLMLRRGRTVSTDAIAPAILKVMKADPERTWTLSQLARKLRKSRQTIYLITMDLRLRREIVLVDASRGLYALPKRGIEVKKSISLLIIQILLATPDHSMRFVALEDSVGSPIAA